VPFKYPIQKKSWSHIRSASPHSSLKTEVVGSEQKPSEAWSSQAIDLLIHCAILAMERAVEGTVERVSANFGLPRERESGLRNPLPRSEALCPEAGGFPRRAARVGWPGHQPALGAGPRGRARPPPAT